MYELRTLGKSFTIEYGKVESTGIVANKLVNLVEKKIMDCERSKFAYVYHFSFKSNSITSELNKYDAPKPPVQSNVLKFELFFMDLKGNIYTNVFSIFP